MTHSRVHRGGKPFACDQCDYKTAQKRDLKNHIFNHTGEKPFACNQCDYKTTRKDSLKIHTMKHSAMHLQLYYALMHSHKKKKAGEIGENQCD